MTLNTYKVHNSQHLQCALLSLMQPKLQAHIKRFIRKKWRVTLQELYIVLMPSFKRIFFLNSICA